MCPAQGPQRSDAGGAGTCGPSVSSQALYHWATALPRFSRDQVVHQCRAQAHIIEANISYFSIIFLNQNRGGGVQRS